MNHNHDLLNACKRALEYFEERESVDYSDKSERAAGNVEHFEAEALRAAIAKAEGKSVMTREEALNLARKRWPWADCVYAMENEPGEPTSFVICAASYDDETGETLSSIDGFSMESWEQAHNDAAVRYSPREKKS